MPVAGDSAEEAAAPAMIEAWLTEETGAKPCRVALLSYTDNEPNFAATAKRPGTNYLEVSL